MTRLQAFRFVTSLTAELSREGPRAEAPWRATLAAFVECFPALYDDEPLFERLGRAPDAGRLEAYTRSLAPAELERLRAAHQPWPREPAQGKALGAQRMPVERALTCLEVLQRLEHGQAVTPDELEDFARTFEILLDAWADEVQPNTDDGHCPDCRSGYVLELDASWHARSCAGHAAMTRLEAVRVAARVRGVELPAGVGAVPLPLEAQPPYGQRWDAKRALQCILGQRPEDSRTKATALLRRAAREWVHFLDRGTDPCPWCGGCFPLKDFGEHLRACPQHPAVRAADEVRRAAAVPPGLEDLVHRRLALRAELQLLSDACTTFDGAMGWCEDGPYSDEYSERPFRAAVARAKRVLGAGGFGFPRHPTGASALRSAMECLLSAGGSPEAQRGAIACVRAEVTRFDEWAAQHGFATTCPACARRGVPRVSLAAHLESCPLHPAVQRARAQAAIEALRGAPLPARLGPGMYDPEPYLDRFAEHYREERDRHLARLYELEPGELSSRERVALEEFVDRWEELSTVASNAPCPWCREAPGAPEHLLACEAHPARGGGEPATPLEALAVKLQLEADTCEVRLARLHEASTVYWNGMRDGEDGKSISNDRLEELQAAAREEAKATLAAIPVELP